MMRMISFSSVFSIALALAACGGSEGGVDTSGLGAEASGFACAVDADCPAGEECEHGACALHGGGGDDDGAAAGPASGLACLVNADCPTGEECEHGACALHGGNGSGGEDNSGSGGEDNSGSGGEDNSGSGGEDNSGRGRGRGHD